MGCHRPTRDSLRTVRQGLVRQGLVRQLSRSGSCLMEIGSNLKQSTALAAAAAAASSGAMAADMQIKAPAPLPPPQTWQGVYFGGSVGASWLHSTQDDTAAIQGL